MTLLLVASGGCSSAKRDDRMSRPTTTAFDQGRVGTESQKPASTRDGQSPIRRTMTHAGYVAEQSQLPGEPELVALLVYRADAARPMPVIVGFPPGPMKKVLDAAEGLPRQTQRPAEIDAAIAGQAPYKDLIDRGVMIAMLSPREIPWAEGRKRWVWPTPDAAGAEFFATWAKVAPWDFGPLIDYLETRDDVRYGSVGYFGFSTTALIGYGLLASDPRVNVAVLAGGAGDLAEFAAGWARNYDWQGKGISLWPETAQKLADHNPLRHVKRIAPKAVLMLNGGDDQIIPIEAARSFFNALLPYYKDQRERVQLVVFEGEGHNWHHPWLNTLLVEWFERFLINGSVTSRGEPRPGS
jgi:hypothetical protein